MFKTIMDELMYQLYSASISLMDTFVIVTIVFLGGWWFLAVLPWFIYSAWQKVKYERSEA